MRNRINESESDYKGNTIRKNILITGMIVILIIAYIAAVVGKKDDQIENRKQENLMEVESYNGRNSEEIKNHFAQYPSNYKELIKYAVPVVTVSVTTNKNMIQNFYEKYKKGKESSLDFITFGNEGGNIYHYIQYNGKDLFYYCFSEEMNDICEIFQNVYLFDVPDKYFDSFDASKLPEPFQVFVLSTDKLSKYDEYENLSEKKANNNEEEQKNTGSHLESFQISPFCTEKECNDFLKANQKDK